MRHLLGQWRQRHAEDQTKRISASASASRECGHAPMESCSVIWEMSRDMNSLLSLVFREYLVHRSSPVALGSRVAYASRSAPTRDQPADYAVSSSGATSHARDRTVRTRNCAMRTHSVLFRASDASESLVSVGSGRRGTPSTACSSWKPQLVREGAYVGLGEPVSARGLTTPASVAVLPPGPVVVETSSASGAPRPAAGHRSRPHARAGQRARSCSGSSDSSWGVSCAN